MNTPNKQAEKDIQKLIKRIADLEIQAEQRCDKCVKQFIDTGKAQALADFMKIIDELDMSKFKYNSTAGKYFEGMENMKDFIKKELKAKLQSPNKSEFRTQEKVVNSPQQVQTGSDTILIKDVMKIIDEYIPKKTEIISSQVLNRIKAKLQEKR
jgi:hypothetical protein